MKYGLVPDQLLHAGQTMGVYDYIVNHFGGSKGTNTYDKSQTIV